MNKREPYYQLIPAKIYDNFEIICSLIEPEIKGFKRDSLLLLLSTIATHIHKDDKGVFYARLKMQYLRNRVWNAGKYIQQLKVLGIIQTYGGFVRNEHSYRYQFSPQYQSPYQKIELTNKKLTMVLKKVKADEGRKACRLYPLQKEILNSLTIDAEQAEKIVRMTYPGSDQTDELNNALGVINRIEQKDWIYKVDEKIHRLHTTITSLPRIIRGEIKLQGKKMLGADIGNSVPLMANKILSDPESCKRFYPEPDKYPIIMLKCLRLSEQQDVRQYALITSSAQFYKCLETEFNKRGCNYEVVSDSKVSKELKAKVFQILFSDNKFNCLEKRVFHQLFPNVNKAFSVLRMYKRDYLNYILGRIESHVILDIILDYLNNNFPEILATQIYDNIIATDDIKKVTMIMTEKIKEFIGVIPTLKTEIF